ncbi:MAG: HipA domain-containing protein [Tissierellia bacterium]|nr:HipA domain-containing protein [Tissierellia bacterium]
MIIIFDFSSWLEYKGASEGSGRSEKIWLENPENGDIGLFKFTKSKYTTEHLSEKIAMEIAKLVDIECMKVDIGKYDNRVGSLSYRINKDGENLVEGIQLINKYYPNYNPETLFDDINKEYYSLEMILNSLKDYDFQREFLKIPVFDFLIGNTDRHQNNWAILQKDEDVRLCPLYDNGSSLCCYVTESNIDTYLGNDKVRFNSLVDTKSTSRIRIDKYIKKEPTQLYVLKFLRENYCEVIVNTIYNIIYNVNENNIDDILREYIGLMSEKRITLIKKFLMEKINLIREEFKI